MADPEQHSDVSPERISLDLGEVIVEQHWIGVVDIVLGDSFEVTLTSQIAGEEEFTTIGKSQISEKDQPRIVEDASFEWRVGYVDDASGRRIGVSIIEFTTPEALTDADRQEAEQAGAKMAQVLIADQSRRHTLD
jgi:hypothetical protein